MSHSIKLSGRVDSATNVDQDDTIKTKLALRALGYYKAPDYGITPYPDEKMFEGIGLYQQANNLRVDGVMKPGGETERSMNRRFESGTRYDGRKPESPNANTPVIHPPSVDPNMPVLKKPFPSKPDPSEDIYTDPFVDEFGNPVLNGKNRKNGKFVRPPART